MSSKIWIVKLTPQAEKDLRYWRKVNPNVFQKCLEILKLLELEPTNLETTGNPEWLRGAFSGCMSRRITKADRCVYQVLKKERIIKVLQMRFHYDDH
jgi:Txe/YoeB family toxin of toxin-antitoxin system